MTKNEVVLDIETSNSFADVGKYDPSLLKVSLVGVYSYATDKYESFLEPDLPKLWRVLEAADRIIGYNLFGFDYHVLNTYYPGDLHKFPTLDVMKEIEQKLGFRIKLDDVAHGSLGVGKSGNGLQAIEFFRRGEIDKLRDYCLMDVKVTKEVYEFGLANKHVKFKDRQGQLVQVPIDFEPKMEKKAVSMTLPL
ncbi:MAG TPA: ribonuclease H-like domain-containing protein [Candidatus Eisenbacteria bacterium]|nr:ribonuclease H-like domain-containing protein [Candidatus Eisenbacteria bacterium]